MKLLMENWRKYLTEGEAEQFPWLKELKDATSHRAAHEVLENKDLFVFVGQGVFRKVYQPIGDKDYVVKIAMPWHDPPHRMNEDDFKLSIEYPLIFPKAYAHSDDFSWVVLEKVSVITDKDEEAMQKVLDKSFPAEQKAIKEEVPRRVLRIDKDGRPRAKLISPDGVIVGHFEDDSHPWPNAIWLPKVVDETPKNPDGNRAPTVIMDLIMASFPSKEEPEAEKKMRDIISPVAGGVYYELSKALAKYSINPREITTSPNRNIGYDKDYNFKIIDSSVF